MINFSIWSLQLNDFFLQKGSKKYWKKLVPGCKCDIGMVISGSKSYRALPQFVWIKALIFIPILIWQCFYLFIQLASIWMITAKISSWQNQFCKVYFAIRLISTIYHFILEKNLLWSKNLGELIGVGKVLVLYIIEWYNCNVNQ